MPLRRTKQQLSTQSLRLAKNILSKCKVKKTPAAKVQQTQSTMQPHFFQTSSLRSWRKVAETSFWLNSHRATSMLKSEADFKKRSFSWELKNLNAKWALASLQTPLLKTNLRPSSTSSFKRNLSSTQLRQFLQPRKEVCQLTQSTNSNSSKLKNASWWTTVSRKTQQTSIKDWQKSLTLFSTRRVQNASMLISQLRTKKMQTSGTNSLCSLLSTKCRPKLSNSLTEWFLYKGK